MYPLFSSANAGSVVYSFDPLLIVGPPRSGSSFLVEALFHAGFGGSNEGHLLPLLAQLDALIEGYYAQARVMGLLDIPGNAIARISESSLRGEMVSLFERLQTRSLPHADRWLDKTVNVEAIGALPFLMSMWPAAKALYLMRDGVANVESAMKYFQVDFDVACKNWAFCGEEWDRVKPLLREDSFLVVDHDDLTEAPEPTAKRIAEHIGLDGSQTERLVSFVVDRTVAWKNGRTERVPLHELGWSERRMATFASICGRQMVSQGRSSQAEVDALLAVALPFHSRLTFDAARVLQIDDEGYFRQAGDGWFIVPGRTAAATLVFQDIEIASRNRLIGELLLAHPAAQPVRVEFLVVATDTGRLILAATIELTALNPVEISFDLLGSADRADCIVRVTLGIGARTNDNAWVRVDRLAFVP